MTGLPLSVCLSPPVRTTWPGMPTTVEWGGTEVTSTEPAPMRLSRPTVIGPEHRRAAEDRDLSLRSSDGACLGAARAAEGDALVERHVVADLGGLADHHAHAVIDEEAPTDLRARMDLDAGEEAAEVAHEAARGQRPRHQSQCAVR